MRSCGCLRREQSKRNGAKRRTHGQSRTRAYRAHVGMLQRCYNPKCKTYAQYGGAQIIVCGRWHQFENFYADLGQCPVGYWLVRIDIRGDYRPDNCRWSDPKAQANNRSNAVRIVYDGRTQTVRQWAAETGVNSATLRGRLSQGWPVGQALGFEPRKAN